MKPLHLEGAYQFTVALFGAPYLSSNCKAMPISIAYPEFGCNEIQNNIKNTVVLTRRGLCNFSDKARLVQKNGGKGLVVVNNISELHMMSFNGTVSDINISSVMITKDDGETFIRYLTENPNKEILIIAIGDIHGQLYQLQSLIRNLEKELTKESLYEDYILVFLGDYIDRGKQVKETIQYLIDLKKKRKENTTHFLLGNHEMALGLFLGFWKCPEGYSFRKSQEGCKNFDQLWKGKHGEEENMHLFGRRYVSRTSGTNYHSNTTFCSYTCHFGDQKGLLKKMPMEHQEFVKNLPWVVESDDFIFVHAGLCEDVDLEEQLKNLYKREICSRRIDQIFSTKLDKYPKNCDKIIVTGHVQKNDVIISDHRIYCDTSGGYGIKRISGIILSKKETLETKVIKSSF
eukprot:gene8827-776_t